MIKLLIVDDEKAIRQTIASLIDWKNLGITLIGSAQNGLEALNIILDESPEIVMTDIRMPGLSGLDLIRQIYELNQDTRFIILSGYEEFEYAKEAMKYGIRHYLLKPCNENQIIDAILSVKSDICRKFPPAADIRTVYSLNEGILFNIISEAFAQKDHDLHKLYTDYGNYIDFDNTPYALHYIYYLEHDVFHSAVHDIESRLTQAFPGFHCFYIYVENTLLLFYPDSAGDYSSVCGVLESAEFPHSSVLPELDGEYFSSLAVLLDKLLPRVMRYEVIYFKMFNSIIPLSNSDSLIKRADDTLTRLLDCADQTEPVTVCLNQMQEILHAIHSLSLMQQAGNIIVTKILADKNTSVSVDFDEITKFCQDFYQCEKTAGAKELLSGLLDRTFLPQNVAEQLPSSDISSRIIDYVSENLADPCLSLKMISEKVLFMNPDHVSKRFIKETKEKFSQYLTRTRMERAKKLLSRQQELNVQKAAEESGYGNNPLYFSQLFKRYTSMTPSRYFKETHSGVTTDDLTTS